MRGPNKPFQIQIHDITIYSWIALKVEMKIPVRYLDLFAVRMSVIQIPLN